MDDQPLTQGGVVLADAPSPQPASVETPVPPPPTPEPPVMTVSPEAPPSPVSPMETVVVAPGENPFIPKGVVPEAPAGVVAPPPSGSSMPRRLLMLGVFLLVVLILIGGGIFLFRLLSGTQEATITYWGLWENDALMQPIIADFEATHPKIKVTYVKQSHKQYRERLGAAIDREDGPDVFRFHNTWIPMLRTQIATAPKTAMTAADFTSTFYPIAKADLVAGETIFGIPMMIDGLGLYYNEDLFAKAGVTAPATWEDVLNLVPKLTVKTDSTILTSAIALGTTNNVEHFSDIVATMMLQNGVSMRDPKGKEAEEALIFYRKFADPADPVYTWNETLDNSVSAFAAGRVAMMIAPSWRAFDVKQINPDMRFKIVPMPQLPGNTVTWASYWVEGVSAKSKKQKQAWEFVAYLASKEVVTKLYTAAGKTRLFGEPYARVDLGNSLLADPYVGAYISQADKAKSFPLASRTFDNGINDKMIKYLEDAINGLSKGSAPTAVLETMAAGFTQVLGTYGLTSSAASQ